MSQTNDLTCYGRNIVNRLGRNNEWATDYAFGSVIGRPKLDLRTREMLTVASLVRLGNAMPQFELHMRAAPKTGVTPTELLEVVIQMAIYASVPAYALMV
ncbi:carboxymuconolactone decarboxylase family protein [Serratia nevei]|uniref:carboxymuconolactone decarboxylase family protein n=1 Tax=Serratia nevei TaxID=2703794 RepID=UPI003FA6C964